MAEIFDQEVYDGPEISERAREAAREFFAASPQGHANNQQEEPVSIGFGTTHDGLDNGPEHANGRGNPDAHGLLGESGELRVTYSMAEFQRLLGAAWFSGYTAGCGGGHASTPMTTSAVRQNAGVLRPLDSGIPVPRVHPNPPTPPESYWTAVLHTRGRYPCGAPAFYVVERPRRDVVAKLELLRIWAAPPMPPGSPPQEPYWRIPLPSDEPVCASCLRPINAYTQEDVNWTEVLI